jgi:hypothetical protein
VIYEIHLYVPKRGQLTPAALEWLFSNGQRTDAPEVLWPVYKLRPRALARLLIRFDPALIPVPSAGADVELHYPDERLGIVAYTHDRGVILFFPFMVYGVYSRVVLGIVYTYIRYLYDTLGFWSYDPQLDLISFADDYLTLEEIALRMDTVIPKQLSSGGE